MWLNHYDLLILNNDQITSKVCYISTFKCYALVECGSNSIWYSGNELLSTNSACSGCRLASLWHSFSGMVIPWVHGLQLTYGRQDIDRVTGAGYTLMPTWLIVTVIPGTCIQYVPEGHVIQAIVRPITPPLLVNCCQGQCPQPFS